jgi:hypothetical protein
MTIFSLGADVLHGSPISPLCYALLIDLEFLKFHMYADDLEINHSRPRDMLSECEQ